jgi:prepilin-type N-terminal cleavage/methylation domain-containing protein
MKMNYRKGFTLVELMVVILIVGILAAVAIPLMQGRIDKAKWSEANAAAGTIRTAVRAYAAETSIANADSVCEGNTCDDSDVQNALGFSSTDLEGVYFTASDYEITSINDSGVAVITVTASKGNAPSGSYQLEADGDWVKQAEE